MKKQIYIKILLIGMFMTLICANIFADNNHAVPYIRMGVGAKALSMGSAFTANPDNISACYWNPAGLTMIENIEFGSMYSTNMGMDRSYNYMGIGMKFNFGVMALSWINASWGDFEGAEDGVPTGTFDLNDHNISFSYAREISYFRIGATAKTYLQTIDEDTENGFGFNVGAIFQPSSLLSMGIMLRDVASKIGDDDIPYQANLGLSVSPIKDVTISGDLRGEKDDSDLSVSVGGEYVLDFKKFTNMNMKSALRIGLNDNNFTAGVGFVIKGMEVNYAYTTDTSEDKIFENSHRISLLMRF